MKLSRKSLIILPSCLIVSLAVAQTISIETVFGIAEQLGVFNTTIHPTLERAEDHEADNIKEIATSMFKMQMSQAPTLRDAHPKGHGCAEAKVQIEESIPDDFRVGTFAEPGKTYDAIIRYSNSQGVAADTVPDGRGMAVKILRAVPNGNLLGTGTTQDLMMVNGPEFFIRSIHDYRLFVQGKPEDFFLGRAIREALSEAQIPDADKISDDSIAKIGQGALALPNPIPLERALLAVLSPFRVPAFTARLLLKLKAVKDQKAPLELLRVVPLLKTVGSSLTESYYSMASYLLKAKSGDTAVKYSVHPIDCESGEALNPAAVPANPDGGFLRTDLAARLHSGSACFELFVQPLPTGISDEARRTLVEDSVLSYDTSEVPVARITVANQSIDTPERLAYCENLSYNPWQTAAEHQPLGSMNRARKVAVTASSIRRHLMSGAKRQEPASLDDWRQLP